MDAQKQSAIDRLKQAANVLVTVNSNPSVDQLAACIGLTIMLNGLGKHGTAVFSGNVPSTIGFLQPEKTLEKNTDSLRDFIISLDKSKADKLRYKVEDTVVRIFITPYRTSINEKDLEFSQGDFNVDVVVALGVHDQKELDQAITSHGRILHDATIISINTQPGNNVGAINWQDPQASSLSEMVASLADSFDKKVMDNQVATALLTGIVAETERFSNDKTSPNTMKVSAQLMAAGANQQLVAEKLEEPPPPPSDDSVHGDGLQPPQDPPKSSDGTLQIDHLANGSTSDSSSISPPDDSPKPNEDDVLAKLLKSREDSQLQVDDHGQLTNLGDDRQMLQGPGPSEAQSVLPSMQETELPSGVPNAGHEFSYDPTAPAEQPGSDPLSGSDNPAGSSASPQSDGQLLQHDDPSDQPPSDRLQNEPTDVPHAEPLDTPPPEPPSEPQSIAPVPSDGSNQASDTGMPSATQIPDFTIPPPGGDSADEPNPVEAVPTDLSVPPPDLSQPVPPIPPPPPVALPPPEPPKPALPDDNEKLIDIEKDINSPHAAQLDKIEARAEVESAEQSGPPPVPEPIAALNAQPMGGGLHDDTQSGNSKTEENSAQTQPSVGKLAEPLASNDKPKDAPLPDALKPPSFSTKPPTSPSDGPTPPPPVPPPMMPIPPTGQ